jgi:uncharacterized SAM-binding protein YcdF (DUF218 family)
MDPFNILLLVIAVTALLWVLQKKKGFRYFLAISAGWFYLITTPFIPYMVLHSLEKKYDPVQTEMLDQNESYHVVVLGAGYYYNERFPANSQLDLITLGRLAEGLRVCNSLENCSLITSGPYFSDIASQAEVAKRAAVLLGFPEEKILIQSEPRTTREEAEIYFSHHHSGETVIVVTTAAHMHRALLDFRRVGIEAIPSPTNFRYKRERGLRFTLIPSPVYVEHLRSGIFEYAALARDHFRS